MGAFSPSNPARLYTTCFNLAEKPIKTYLSEFELTGDGIKPAGNTLLFEKGTPCSLGLSLDSSLAAVGDGEGSIHIASMASTAKLTCISNVHTFVVSSVSFAPAGNRALLSSSLDKTVAYTPLPDSRLKPPKGRGFPWLLFLTIMVALIAAVVGAAHQGLLPGTVADPIMEALASTGLPLAGLRSSPPSINPRG